MCDYNRDSCIYPHIQMEEQQQQFGGMSPEHGAQISGGPMDGAPHGMKESSGESRG